MKLIKLLPTLFFLLLSACTNQNKPAQQDTLTTKPPIAAIDPTPQQEITCKEIVYQVLTSSSRFKELTHNLYNAVVKNGGTSYGIGLEGSPNPAKDSAMDYSKTYDLALHETYTDRDVVTARFTFNPTAGQLYEYDVAEDSLLPIDFDKKLLLRITAICK